MWACGFSPPGVSQALYPTLEALGLRRHKTGVMKGISQDRHALHGGKQVHGKAVGVFPLPECPKLALDPGQVLSEDLGRSGGDRAARHVVHQSVNKLIMAGIGKPVKPPGRNPPGAPNQKTPGFRALRITAGSAQSTL